MNKTKRNDRLYKNAADYILTENRSLFSNSDLKKINEDDLDAMDRNLSFAINMIKSNINTNISKRTNNICYRKDLNNALNDDNFSKANNFLAKYAS